jgi:predicted ribosome quality control (RQC) complex YloA/Tae2 family protein
MIQYYLDLQKQVKNIREKCLTQGQIQKIYSTAWFISFAIRAPGKTWYIYFGRGGGYEGIWSKDSPPPSELRRRDNFLEYFRKHMSSCTFLDLEMDKFDRILKMTYQKFGKKQSFLWFWKGRKLYFIHHYQEQPEAPFKIMLSWRSKSFFPESQTTELFEYFDEIGRQHNMNHDLESEEIPTISKIMIDELKASSLKGNSSAPTFLQRKKENIQDDLRKTRQWEKLQFILDKGVSLQDLYELKVEDQKIKFEGELNLFERRNLVFQKIKKLKRGELILKERLGSVEEQLAGKLIESKKMSTIPINKPIWGDEKPHVKGLNIKINHEEFKIFRFNDFQVGVGVNAQGNDQLRNNWASKDDHWLHLDGLKSSHAVIKLFGTTILNPEILNIGASIVAHFSHFYDDWIPIIYTQVKNLKGISGSAGMVIYKKEKHLRCPKVDIANLIKE